MVGKFIWIAFTKKSNTSKMVPLKFSSLIFVRDTSQGKHFERALLELIAHFQLEDTPLLSWNGSVSGTCLNKL